MALNICGYERPQVLSADSVKSLVTINPALQKPKSTTAVPSNNDLLQRTRQNCLRDGSIFQHSTSVAACNWIWNNNIDCHMQCKWRGKMVKPLTLQALLMSGGRTTQAIRGDLSGYRKLAGCWLTVIPNRLDGTILSAEEFRDNLRLRYNSKPTDMPDRYARPMRWMRCQINSGTCSCSPM